MKRLPDAELEVMHVIWETAEAVTSDYIRSVLKNDWAKTTLLNFLIRLTDRGFVKCEKSGRINYYSALISKDDYMREEHYSILKKFHKKSITDLVASFYDVDAIDDSDLAELENFIKGVK